jgi:16S rRNA (cytidine1402-2'-O)-methyltransferase
MAKLLIVGTPLGNLGDFPPRAVEALRDADLILCEDTRHTRKLLTHFRIERPLERFDDHTEDAKAAAFADRIAAGETIALVSDAGMPVVSDPGYRLVRLARERGLTVEPIPGPFAGVLALVASGIAPLPFTFLGFAPHRSGDRRDFYRRLAALGHTTIVYESPERIVASLQDALEVAGDVEVAVGREMTKLHEEILRGQLSEVLADLRSRPAIYGEITVVFGAALQRAAEPAPEEIAAEFELLRAKGLRRNDAVKAVAEKFGLRKNDVYKFLLDGAGN